MADPRRIIPTRPSAQRLSDDIGDVLTAIRRLIAEDEALVSARDRLQQARGDAPPQLTEVPKPEAEDPAEQLARRYGGNAALARQLAHLHDDLDLGAAPEGQAESALADEDANAAWPLGPFANDPEAARPRLVEQPLANEINDDPADPGADFEQMLGELDEAAPEDLIAVPDHRNDLARRLSATFPALEPADASSDDDIDADEAEEAQPLLLDPDRRIPSLPLPAGQALRPDAPEWTPLTLASRADMDAPQDSPLEGRGRIQQPDAAPAGQSQLARVDFEDDFDWKARMRPDLDELAETAAPPQAQDVPEVDPDPAPLVLLDAVAPTGTEAEEMAADDAARQAEVAGAAPADPFLSVPMISVLPA